ncbi:MULTISPECIES: DUF2180 family protein [Streptomyces]|uniref:DUF2180 family protein n=1 Tax=Streptomyces cadmiisoli TaxID=2184053 RepID=A0A2Z4ITI0_9ACTN|nr:DUF2180 family protein [Streptomyces cadmiisoli]
MNCYECSTQSGATTTAEGVCQRCGAGICADHVRLRTQELQQQAGMGSRSQPQPARRLLCPQCDKVEPSRPRP